jgi:uncharacterized protein YdaU (DUF1376 family)
MKLAYFPFYPDDWISSPKVMLMTMERRGIYITLLAHAWNFPGGALPEDMSILQRFCHGARRKNIEYVLETCFERRGHEGGGVAWTNPRLLHERSRSIVKHEKASESVKYTKRYINKQSNDNQTIIERLSNQNQNQNQNYKEPKTNVSFDAFWSAYPRHVAKVQAQKAWNKISPDDGLLHKILTSIEKYKTTDQWKKDNGKFIPHAATWLNQRRWEDEITPIRKGDPGLSSSGAGDPGL